MKQLRKERQSGGELWRWMLVLTRGLDSECCGEERTSMGMPRAGLVPEPLLPANWPQGKLTRVYKQRQKRKKTELLFRRNLMKDHTSTVGT